MSYLASFPSVKVLNSCIYLCTFFIFTIKYTQTISTSLRFIYACVLLFKALLVSLRRGQDTDESCKTYFCLYRLKFPICIIL